VRVHQFTATLNPRDAVGFHTLEVDAILRELGHDTELFATSIHPELRSRAHQLEDHEQVAPPDVLLYQLSTGSPVAEYLLARSEPLVLNYHNLTPAEFFDPWEPSVGAELHHGLRQVSRLARRATGAIADSAFNGAALVAEGLEDVAVVPVLFAPIASTGGSDEEIESEERDDPLKPLLLFVGRLAPNKCQHDLISTLTVLRRSRPGAELVLVGTASSAQYESALRSLAGAVCPDAVTFAGSVSFEKLAAWYRRADVFVSMSAHEGFGVPLVEAMEAGVPVVARAAGAVPETVGSAGLLLDGDDPVVAAAAISRVLDDETVRNQMIVQGRQRARELSLELSRQAMAEALSNVLERARSAP